MKTLGIVIIVLGIIALPTPAPGWLIIGLGVKVLRSATTPDPYQKLIDATNLFEIY